MYGPLIGASVLYNHHHGFPLALNRVILLCFFLVSGFVLGFQITDSLNNRWIKLLPDSSESLAKKRNLKVLDRLIGQPTISFSGLTVGFIAAGPTVLGWLSRNQLNRSSHGSLSDTLLIIAFEVASSQVGSWMANRQWRFWLISEEANLIVGLEQSTSVGELHDSSTSSCSGSVNSTTNTPAESGPLLKLPPAAKIPGIIGYVRNSKYPWWRSLLRYAAYIAPLLAASMGIYLFWPTGLSFPSTLMTHAGTLSQTLWTVTATMIGLTFAIGALVSVLQLPHEQLRLVWDKYGHRLRPTIVIGLCIVVISGILTLINGVHPARTLVAQMLLFLVTIGLLGWFVLTTVTFISRGGDAPSSLELLRLHFQEELIKSLAKAISWRETVLSAVAELADSPPTETLTEERSSYHATVVSVRLRRLYLKLWWHGLWTGERPQLYVADVEDEVWPGDVVLCSTAPFNASKIVDLQPYEHELPSLIDEPLKAIVQTVEQNMTTGDSVRFWKSLRIFEALYETAIMVAAESDKTIDPLQSPFSEWLNSLNNINLLVDKHPTFSWIWASFLIRLFGVITHYKNALALPVILHMALGTMSRFPVESTQLEEKLEVLSYSDIKVRSLIWDNDLKAFSPIDFEVRSLIWDAVSSNLTPSIFNGTLVDVMLDKTTGELSDQRSLLRLMSWLRVQGAMSMRDDPSRIVGSVQKAFNKADPNTIWMAWRSLVPTLSIPLSNPAGSGALVSPFQWKHGAAWFIAFLLISETQGQREVSIPTDADLLQEYQYIRDAIENFPKEDLGTVCGFDWDTATILPAVSAVIDPLLYEVDMAARRREAALNLDRTDVEQNALNLDDTSFVSYMINHGCPFDVQPVTHIEILKSLRNKRTKVSSPAMVARWEARWVLTQNSIDPSTATVNDSQQLIAELDQMRRAGYNPSVLMMSGVQASHVVRSAEGFVSKPGRNLDDGIIGRLEGMDVVIAPPGVWKTQANVILLIDLHQWGELTLGAKMLRDRVHVQIDDFSMEHVSRLRSLGNQPYRQEDIPIVRRSGYEITVLDAIEWRVVNPEAAQLIKISRGQL